jgi:hypothetical protein
MSLIVIIVKFKGMYINKGLSIICFKIGDETESPDKYQEELVRLLCPYAGKHKNIEVPVRDALIKASSIFLDESIETNKSILSLFGEWLGDGHFRHRCLHEKKLIFKGSGILEVFTHECVLVPVLQLLYENINWTTDVPDDVLKTSNGIAIKQVGKYLNKIYENS